MGTGHSRFQPSSRGHIVQREEEWSPKASYSDTKYVSFYRKPEAEKKPVTRSSRGMELDLYTMQVIN